MPYKSTNRIQAEHLLAIGVEKHNFVIQIGDYNSILFSVWHGCKHKRICNDGNSGLSGRRCGRRSERRTLQPMRNWQVGYSAAELGELARLLGGDYRASPPPGMLRAANLEPWAYIALPRDDPRRNACRRAFLDARGRHALLKNEVHDMVRAWNAAGIVPLLYKGFALAEFVYPQPGMRFHGDVDVLVSMQDFEAALSVGHSRGWHTPQFDDRTIRGVDPHELALKRKGANASFDLHQRLLPSLGRSISREHELTRLAWENASEVDWEGANIRLLSHADSFLCGIVLARCWNGDNWTPKPHDILDGMHLIAKGLTRIEIADRSAQIGNKSTTEIFMRHCDPFRRFVDLKKISHFRVANYESQSLAEHFPPIDRKSVV